MHCCFSGILKPVTGQDIKFAYPENTWRKLEATSNIMELALSHSTSETALFRSTSLTIILIRDKAVSVF